MLFYLFFRYWHR